MNPKHEKLLSELTTEYPERMEELNKYAEIVPPVKVEYLESLCENDEQLKELFDDMLTYFYRYTKDVCYHESLKKGDRDENQEMIVAMEDPRSSLHNSMIDSVKIFVRHLNAKGKDTSWFDDIDNKGRAGYATLALLTTLHEILRNGRL